MQMLMRRDGKYFDKLTLESGDELRVVYFDVSSIVERGLRLGRRRVARYDPVIDDVLPTY